MAGRSRHAACTVRELAGWFVAALAVIALVARRAPPCPYVWHGGNPNGEPRGSCWVGTEGYAMCTPSLAIDLVIESGADSVVLVKRSDSGTYATMGGFVDVGEAPHMAVARELREETALELAAPPLLLGVFGDPRRDPRRHTVSAVYVARTVGTPHPGSDARAVVTVPVAQLRGLDYAFDHASIIEDYLAWRGRPRAAVPADPEPFRGGAPVARDSCT
mgnify:CR=1 FL=1